MAGRYLHYSTCKCGTRGKVLEPSHPWYVKSPEHDNCFWVYLRHNCEPHTLLEIGELLGLSISAITTIERRAFTKLRKRVKNLIGEESKKSRN